MSLGLMIRSLVVTTCSIPGLVLNPLQEQSDPVKVLPLPGGPGGAAKESQPDLPDFDGKSQGWFDLKIVPPLTEQEVDVYADYLQLNDKQRNIFRTSYEMYRHQDTSLRKQFMPSLRAWSSDLSSGGAIEHQGPGGAKSWQNLMAERDQFMNRAESLEEDFFYNFEEHLTNKQSSRLLHVILRRARTRAASLGSRYPGSTFDLVKFLWDQKDTFKVVDKDGYDTIIQSYDVVVTPLFKRRATALLSAYTNGVNAMASVPWHLGHHDPQYKAAINDALAERSSLYNKCLDSSKRIITVNEQYLADIMTTLVKEDARRLRDQYNRAVYSQVYPDPYDVAPVLRKALELDSLEQNMQRKIEELLEQYIPLRQSISRQLIRTLRESWETTATTMTTSPARESNMHVRLAQLRKKRSANSQQIMTTLQGILGEKKWEKLKVLIDFPGKSKRQNSAGKRPRPAGVR